MKSLGKKTNLAMNLEGQLMSTSCFTCTVPLHSFCFYAIFLSVVHCLQTCSFL